MEAPEDEGRMGKHTVGRAGLALASIAVIVAREDRGVHVDRVGDGLAETVAGERHFESRLESEV